MTGFGNTGNLQIAIVGSVCHSSDQPFGPDCNRIGIAYVSFAQWVAVILVYTLVYHMMEPPMEYYEVVQDGKYMREFNCIFQAMQLMQNKLCWLSPPLILPFIVKLKL
jgi:auxin efflux carrier family protein